MARTRNRNKGSARRGSLLRGHSWQHRRWHHLSSRCLALVWPKRPGCGNAAAGYAADNQSKHDAAAAQHNGGATAAIVSLVLLNGLDVFTYWLEPKRKVAVW